MSEFNNCEPPAKIELQLDRFVVQPLLQLANLLTAADFRKRRSMLRRLNRAEYGSTLRDLLEGSS